MTPSELLDLIIDRAPRLRAAGVRHVRFDAVSIDIDPPEPTPIALPTEERHESTDPLDDPSTYGRKSGTPGFDFTDTDDDLTE